MKTKKTEKPKGIPQQQWEMPAGFSADGKKLATLRDVASPETATLEIPQLSTAQKVKLTAERIRRQRKYKMGMVGGGVIDRARAIAEVEAQSDVGRTLTEIELRTIHMLTEMARK